MKTLQITTLLCAVLLLTGCAHQATINGMVADGDIVGTAPPNHPLYNALLVESVHGGESTNPMWTSEIGSAEFKAALRQSLARAGLLAPGLSQARYIIDADLLSVDQPMFGFTFDVKVQARYLIKSRRGALLSTKLVDATGTAGVGDAFFGVARLRIASERAARENIKVFISGLLSEDGKALMAIRQ